jgi:peptidoglycan/xylan/chitin deacetylase (PgdA/CDA1 family)
MTGVPILMYHSISEQPPAATAPLAVPPGAFAEQMALLDDRGFTPIPLSGLPIRRSGEVRADRSAPAAGRPVVITFDDGYADLHENALPILERHGFTATAFVTTGWLADAGAHAAGRPPDRTLSWGQVREVAAHGVEIGAHAHSHPQLDQLAGAPLYDELTCSRGLLEDALGVPVQAMAYPYGYSSARVRRAALHTGYRRACAVANEIADPARHDRLALPRLTVRAGTTIERFGRIVEGEAAYRMEHALTKGYAVVRRSRYAARRMLRDV